MKTLVCILHYNTIEYTDVVYRSLKPYEKNDYDLIVLDNGSTITSKFTTHKVSQNVYFGGGLNLAMQLVLNNDKYDSLVFVSSDLIIHGYNFIKTLRYEMFNNNFKLLSPAIIQPEEGQCYWPTMHNWNSVKTRNVPWVDFQCPMLHIDLIKKIKQYDEDLIFGWGNDVYSGLICKDNNWKVGVVDRCAIIHFSNATVKAHLNDDIISNYNFIAEQNMYKYFNKIKRYDELMHMRNIAREYTYDK